MSVAPDLKKNLGVLVWFDPPSTIYKLLYVVCLFVDYNYEGGGGGGVSLYLMLHADHAYDSRTCYCKLVNLKRIKLKSK